MMDTESMPLGMTLHGMVGEAIVSWPHRDSVIYDDGVQVSRLTYSTFGKISQKVCNWLRQCGILEEIVAVALRPSLYLPSVLTGIMMAPAAFLPVNLQGARSTLSTTLDRLKIRAVLADSSQLETLLKILGRQKRVDWIEDLGIAVVWVDHTKGRCAWTSPLAYVITTSGSTGDPKVVRVPHGCIVPNVSHIRSLYKLSPSDVSILMSPLTFDPAIVEIYAALSSGSRLLLIPDVIKMVPELLIGAITRHQVTVMQATPSVVWNLGSNLLKSRVLCSSGSLRILSLGGEKCPNPAVLRSWCDARNVTTFINLYGITEVSSWALHHVLTTEELSSDVEVPLGSPLESTRYEVRNDQGELINQGEGQLVIGSCERICLLDDEHPPTDGMRATGDRVLIGMDGQLFYRGRIDQQVKRHGMRLNLESLEQVAMETEIVSQCVALLTGHEQLHLVIRKPTSSSCQGQDKIMQCSRLEKQLEYNLRSHLHQKLPVQYMPDSIWSVNSLPYTRHGKIDKTSLQDIITKHCKPKPLESSNTTRKQIVEQLWKECLYLPMDYILKATDTFMSSGGDSFSAVRFLNVLSEDISDLSSSLLETILTKTYNDVLTSVGDPSNSEITWDINDTDRAYTGKVSPSRSTKRPIDSTTDETAKRQLLDSKCPNNQKSDFDDRELCTGAISRANRETHLCGSDLNQCCLSLKLIQHAVHTSANLDVRIDLKPKWFWDTGKCIDASPLLLKRGSASLVFIGSHSHKFAAVCMHTGNLVWEQVLGDRVESSACISPCGENVVVGCYDGLIYVLDVLTGTVMWTFATGGQVKSSPYCDPNTRLVYIGSHDQHVYALNIKKKICQWQRHLGAGSVYSSPVAFCNPKQVYVGTLGGFLVAIDSVSGEVSWKQNVGKPIFSSPCLIPGGVVVGCVDSKLYSFTYDGNQLWTFQSSGPIFSSPCLSSAICQRQCDIQISNRDTAHDRIIFGCHGNMIYCVDIKGNEIWRFQTESEVFASPFVHSIALSSPNDTVSQPDLTKWESSCHMSSQIHKEEGQCTVVIVSTTRGRICVLSMTDGRLLGEHRLGGDVFSSPVICNGRVYVGCRDNNLYCLEVACGSRSLKDAI